MLHQCPDSPTASVRPIPRTRLVSAVVTGFALAALSATPIDAGPSDAELVADHVIQTFLAAESATDPEAPYLYVREAPLASGDLIAYGTVEGTSEHTAAGGEYLAWIDDGPGGAMFHHESRILLARVNGSAVAVETEIETSIPVIVNDQAIWSDVLDAVGSELRFPDVTFHDVLDPDPSPPESGASGRRFNNAQNASALVLYGNSEESNATDTITEINDILDDMGIPAGNRDTKLYPQGTVPTKAQIEAAITAQGMKGSGPEFVLFVAAHGYKAGDGGVCFNAKGKQPAGCFDWSEIICSTCKALDGTNKSRVLLVANSCFAGKAIDTLVGINTHCNDCLDFTIGIAAACKPFEKAYASSKIFFDGTPWDFIEELEDEDEDWGAAVDLMVAAERAVDGARADIDRPTLQHPEWYLREVTPVAVERASWTRIKALYRD